MDKKKPMKRPCKSLYRFANFVVGVVSAMIAVVVLFD